MKLSILDQSPVPEGLTPAQAIQNSIDLARLGDEHGYTRYWLAEHHAFEALASTAPEVLLARIGAETKRIRIGSGAVLLPHYSAYKVAEQFRTLHAMYPDRIDLGIGRAPGGGPIETRALARGNGPVNTDNFPQQLTDLLDFLGEGEFAINHPYRNLHVSPDMPGRPRVWLLGSSEWSAVTAASYSLPYAFAHFISPEPTRAALGTYMHRFEPSGSVPEPAALVCVGAVVAPTQEEADYIASSVRLWSRNIRLGMRDNGLISPAEATQQLQSGPDPSVFDSGEWPRIFVGTPAGVRERMESMAHQLNLDEVMVLTLTHDPAMRLRSYSLLAKAFSLSPAQPS